MAYRWFDKLITSGMYNVDYRYQVRGIKVLFPHPDGPISAVAELRLIPNPPKDGLGDSP